MEKNSKIVLLFTSINYKPLCLKLVKLHGKGKKKKSCAFMCYFFIQLMMHFSSLRSRHTWINKEELTEHNLSKKHCVCINPDARCTESSASQCWAEESRTLQLFIDTWPLWINGAVGVLQGEQQEPSLQFLSAGVWLDKTVPGWASGPGFVGNIMGDTLGTRCSRIPQNLAMKDEIKTAQRGED